MGCGSSKSEIREQYQRRQPPSIEKKSEQQTDASAQEKKEQQIQKEQDQRDKQKDERFKKMSIFKSIFKGGSQRLELGDLKEVNNDKAGKLITLTTNASTEMRKKYKSTEQCLGKGSFGQVFLFTNLDGTRDYAVKIIVKELIPEKELKVMKQEIGILSGMEHPNIVNYTESYEDARYLYIVMEYVQEAIDLDTLIKNQNKNLNEGKPLMQEQEVANIMHMLLSGVLHIHTLNVVHRDLKPENILIDKHKKIKIIDFGLAKTEDADLIGNALVGTPYYMAPEIFEQYGEQECYKPPVDIYALGIIMYQLLSGKYPFDEDDDFETLKLSQQVQFHDSCWNNISQYAIKMIKEMTERIPEIRATAQTLLHHDWFDHTGFQTEEKPIEIDPEVIKRLSNFKSLNRMKRACLNLIVRGIDESQLILLDLQFKGIDKDGTNTISAQDLWNVIQNLQLQGQISKENVNQIVKEIDVHGNGRINYSEFIAATLEAQNFLTEQRVWDLFKTLDVHNAGYLTYEGIKQAMSRTGSLNSCVTEDDIKQMIEEANLKNSKRIKFDEFKTIFIKKEAEVQATIRAAKQVGTIRDQVKKMKFITKFN